ncbi:MAG: hypothetical protein ABUL49_00400, partial [bacterium]
MAKVIGVLPTAGGVGATTLCIHLAQAWALAGKKVAIVATGREAEDLTLLAGHTAMFQGEEPSAILSADTSGELSSLIKEAWTDVVIVDLPVGYNEGEINFSA